MEGVGEHAAWFADQRARRDAGCPYDQIVKFQPTSFDDLAQLRAWVSTKEEMMLWSGPTFTWPLTDQQLRTYLGNPQRRYWSAMDPDSGEMTGHASLLVDQPAQMMRLGYIIVDPQRRGQSLGRELVQHTTRAGFRLTGLPTMKLHVYAHNTPARCLYASLGFKETGVRFRVDDNQDALEMEVCRSEVLAAEALERR